MSNDKSGQAFPYNCNPETCTHEHCAGLTKRELGAFILGSGVCHNIRYYETYDDEAIAKRIITLTDALIEALGK